jgi:hypothetical protein
MDFNDKKTSMMKLVDLLKTHEPLMQKCPEVIEIIENLYIEIEMMQIIDAVNYGCSDFGSVKNAKQYYNETYNQ